MTIKSFNNTVFESVFLSEIFAAIKLLQRATIITTSCKFGVQKKQSNKLKLIFLCFSEKKNKIKYSDDAITIKNLNVGKKLNSNIEI